MAVHFEIVHTTTYKYASPVTFGTHCAMFLSGATMRGRLLRWSAKTSLRSAIRWVSDPLGNNMTVMDISEPGSELSFTFQFSAIHFGTKGVEEFPLEPRAEEVPVQYTPNEWTDLAAFIRPHAEDSDSSVPRGAKALSPATRTEPRTSCDGCSIHSTRHSPIGRERVKAPWLQGRPSAPGRGLAGTMPGS